MTSSAWHSVSATMLPQLPEHKHSGMVKGANIFVPLQRDAILQIAGEDARSFLQAQLSNDVEQLESPGAQLTSWSSAKGRVLATAMLVRHNDTFYLRFPIDLQEQVHKRLSMFVLRAKVEIKALRDYAAAGLVGTAAVEALSSEIGQPLPQQSGAALQHGDLLVIRVRDEASPRYEVQGPVAELAALYQRLESTCEIADEGAWRLLDVDSGIPQVTAATSEAFVLQMLNLQQLDGVSFKKGCYPGQEVIARMQYLGKLKRRMFRLSATTREPLVAGSEIHLQQEGGSAVGKIVSAEMAGASECRLLAVLAIDKSAEALQCQGVALELLDLPYSAEPPSDA